MALKTKQVTIGPTDGAGAFSIDVNLPGKVVAVGVVIGTLANTVDLAITDLITGAAIFSKSNISATALFQPKMVPVSVAAAALNTAGDVAYDSPACLRQAHIVLAQGGDTKTGTLYLLVDA